MGPSGRVSAPQNGLGLAHPFFGVGGFGPFAGDLSRGDVEAVPDIGHADVEEDSRELGLVVMALRFVLHVVGNGIWAVVEAGNGFGEYEGGSFGVGEIRGFAPSGNGEEALGGFVLFLETKAHIHAHATTIDLAGAQVHES